MAKYNRNKALAGPDGEVHKYQFKGVNLPADLVIQLFADGVTETELKCLILIESIDELNTDGCFASNRYIAHQLRVQPMRASQVIASLKAKGWLHVYEKNGRRHLLTDWSRNKERVSRRKRPPIAPRDTPPIARRDTIKDSSLRSESSNSQDEGEAAGTLADARHPAADPPVDNVNRRQADRTPPTPSKRSNTPRQDSLADARSSEANSNTTIERRQGIAVPRGALIELENDGTPSWATRCARRLHDAVKSHYGLRRTFSIKAWAAPLVALVRLDDWEQQAVEDTVEWYAANPGCWRIQGGASFREWFETIEGKRQRAVESAKQSGCPAVDTPMSPETREVFDDLATLPWPDVKELEGLVAFGAVEAAILYSHAAGLMERCASRELNGVVREDDARCYEAVVREILAALGNTDTDFLKRWFLDAHSKVRASKEWWGSLKRIGFHRGHARLVILVKGAVKHYGEEPAYAEAFLKSLQEART